MPKRKVAANNESAKPESAQGDGPSGHPQQPSLVNQRRVSTLLDANPGACGPVVYWMSRDMRVRDNWALLQGCQQALQRSSPFVVAFNLVPEFLGAGARSFCFLLKGLRETEAKLSELNIPFYLLRGDPAQTIPQLVSSLGASMVVADYSPLRLSKQWKQEVVSKLEGKGVGFQVVDAHNVVPATVVSDKREYAARTIRPKIHRLLPEFFVEYPNQGHPPPMPKATNPSPPPRIDWPALLEEVAQKGAAVPEVHWITPGETAAHAALNDFVSSPRLAKYKDARNDPSCPTGLSNLSPYMHFGQLSPQRVALAAVQHRSRCKDSADRFFEELVVRRELADNFCEKCPEYDKLVPGTVYDWALQSLIKHKKDARPVIYSRQQLEDAQTGDELWNAGQREMRVHGKMHGYIRMYWAKKILEWTSSPEEAIEIAIYLNDKWSLDGRDPSGYTGVMWSVAGVSDRAWVERPIYGKIRIMTYDGCKSKFNVPAYIAYVNGLCQSQHPSQPQQPQHPQQQQGQQPQEQQPKQKRQRRG